MDKSMDFGEQIQKNLEKILRKNLQGILGEDAKIHLEHPAVAEHGDYSTNVAMAIFGNDKWQNPKEAAEWVKEEYYKLGDEVVEKVEVAGPGFVNFYLSKDTLLNGLKQFDTSKLEFSKSGEGKTLVVDYSAPNIAKPFGIGHLRSTIIGQAIYNLYKTLGWKVIGDNHVGDWGTQFGALIYKVLESKIPTSDLTIDKLEELYVAFNTEATENPELKDEARKWFKKLEDGDRGAREIWEELKRISFEEYDRIYSLLGIKIDEVHGEAFYEGMFEEIIKECIDRGVAKESEGALIIEYPDGMAPGIVRKSDGASTYLTRDLATVKYRIENWKPDFVIYEVGVEQSLHFKQIFAAVELLGWAKKEDFYHLPHGLYLSPNGKKFSTRRGDTVHLEDVLLEAVERAKKLGKDVDAATAMKVGIGAIKYYDLSHQPQSDIIFDWEKVFALEGNSAPYIQYTYARTQSVIGRAGPAVGQPQKYSHEGATPNFGAPRPTSPAFEPEEVALLRYYYRYPEVIGAAAKSYSPNFVATYLFEISQKFNHFYNTNRILEAEGEQKELRLNLTKVVGNILKSGLEILGIEAPEKM